MFGSWAFDHRVTIQKVTSTYDGIDSTESWTSLATVWCCVSQATNEHSRGLLQNEGERMARNVSYRLVFRERFYDYFDDPLFFANYRFFWTDESLYLKPTNTAVSPGKRFANYTYIWAEDVTNIGQA